MAGEGKGDFRFRSRVKHTRTRESIHGTLNETWFSPTLRWPVSSASTRKRRYAGCRSRRISIAFTPMTSRHSQKSSVRRLLPIFPSKEDIGSSQEMASINL